MIHRSRLLMALAAVIPLAGCVSSSTGPARRVHPASLEILVHGRLELSAWFADSEGTVITAAHGITGHTNGFTALMPDGRRLPMDRIALDPHYDLALLRVRNLGGPVPYLRVAATEAEPGERVWFHGSAEFRHGLTIEGNVARAEPTFNYYGKHDWMTHCHLIAAPSPPGTSGGPWVNGKGEVVANQSGYINSATAPAGIALVTPARAIRDLLQRRRDRAPPTLGCGFEEIWTQPVGFIRRLPSGLSGLVTIPISEGGPAAKAGLTKESVITRIDGKPMRYTYDLLSILDERVPGESIELEVFQPDQKIPRMVRVTLGAAKY